MSCHFALLHHRSAPYIWIVQTTKSLVAFLKVPSKCPLAELLVEALGNGVIFLRHFSFFNLCVALIEQHFPKMYQHLDVPGLRGLHLPMPQINAELSQPQLIRLFQVRPIAERTSRETQCRGNIFLRVAFACKFSYRIQINVLFRSPPGQCPPSFLLGRHCPPYQVLDALARMAPWTRRDAATLPPRPETPVTRLICLCIAVMVSPPFHERWAA